MIKRQYLFAIASFLLIPAAVLAGGVVFALIDPEMAAGHADYARNYRLLEFLRNSALLAGLAVAVLLWFATCAFVVRAKGRRTAWVLMGFLGPWGFIVLGMLDDLAPMDRDRYQQVVGRLGRFLRAVYEAAVFFAVWTLAYGAMVLWRQLKILAESAQTGVSPAQILQVQNASSGMWAFGEGIEILFLVALMYLFRPLLFNLIACFFSGWKLSRRD